PRPLKTAACPRVRYGAAGRCGAGVRRRSRLRYGSGPWIETSAPHGNSRHGDVPFPPDPRGSPPSGFARPHRLRAGGPAAARYFNGRNARWVVSDAGPASASVKHLALERLGVLAGLHPLPAVPRDHLSDYRTEEEDQT